ncbi:MAG: LPXTG cell wall anchor domain-containing protein, partial [Ruminococcaceae bacterium]|nr:LPXTG cell wall anchor domain-containing protein [Oscillospiraceae bacterium]
SGGDDGLTEILDEEVPLTGDSFNVIYIPIMIGALAAFGVAAYFLLKKKKAE